MFNLRTGCAGNNGKSRHKWSCASLNIGPSKTMHSWCSARTGSPCLRSAPHWISQLFVAVYISICWYIVNPTLPSRDYYGHGNTAAIGECAMHLEKAWAIEGSASILFCFPHNTSRLSCPSVLKWTIWKSSDDFCRIVQCCTVSFYLCCCRLLLFLSMVRYSTV